MYECLIVFGFYPIRIHLIFLCIDGGGICGDCWIVIDYNTDWIYLSNHWKLGNTGNLFCPVTRLNSGHP